MNHGKHRSHGNLLYEAETYRIRSAVFEVYRNMGAGFLEAVYQECLAIEFATSGVPFLALRPLQLQYKGQALQQTYRPDFVCFDRIVLEIKAVRALAPEHRAQTLNYLRATGLRLGLLVNFGADQRAQIERLVL